MGAHAYRFFPFVTTCVLGCPGLFLLLVLPVSVYYTRVYREVVAQYAELRREHGCAQCEWPDPKLERDLHTGSGVYLGGGALALTLTLLGIFTEIWRANAERLTPGYRTLPPWPLLYVGVALGAVASLWLFRTADVRARSPWMPVQRILRKASRKKFDKRRDLLLSALEVDPEIRAVRMAAEKDAPEAAGGQPAAT